MASHFVTVSPWILIPILGLSIPILAIILDFIKSMARLRYEKYLHLENIERMRSGYPPIELKGKGKGKKSFNSEEVVVDMTDKENRAN
jgi:hypothetical protein